MWGISRCSWSKEKGIRGPDRGDSVYKGPEAGQRLASQEKKATWLDTVQSCKSHRGNDLYPRSYGKPLRIWIVDFPGSPVVKTALPSQWVWVLSLARELRSCLLCGMAKKLKLKHINKQKNLNRIPDTCRHGKNLSKRVMRSNLRCFFFQLKSSFLITM